MIFGHYMRNFVRFNACFSTFWNLTGKVNKTDLIRPLLSTIGLKGARAPCAPRLDPPMYRPAANAVFTECWTANVSVSFSDNMVGRINEVALRSAGLVLRWVIVVIRLVLRRECMQCGVDIMHGRRN